MKRKNFLVLLAAGCLFSCQQQDELQETSKEATNFSISIDDALSDPLTRTSSDLFPAKNSITTGEVISMAFHRDEYIFVWELGLNKIQGDFQLLGQCYLTS